MPQPNTPSPTPQPPQSNPVRDVVVAIAAMLFSGILATRQVIPGLAALCFVLLVILPPNVLRSYATVLLAKGQNTQAVALLGFASTLSALSAFTVAALGAATAIQACL